MSNSQPFTITIQAQGAFTPPYSLPAAGQVVAIGTNNAMSVVPSGEGWGTSAWDYSNFGSYGGGVFVPTYSQGGAWVAAGTGGHNHPDNHGALLFDFADATWKRLDNANGVPRRPSYPHSYSLSMTSGSPYHEISGSAVPAPGHPYCLNNYLPSGPNGSIILVTRAALAVEATGSGSVHVFDLDTRLWSRYTTGTASRGGVESDSLYDAARNRHWLIPLSLHLYGNQTYLDHSDKQWKLTASHSAPSADLAASYCRCFMHDGLIMRQLPNGTLWYFDPDNASAGWGQCTVSGTMPSSRNSFVRYSNGNYYHKANAASSSLTRLRPPANPKTGTWLVDTVSLTGPTLPLYNPTYAAGLDHYKNLIYVPAIDCLAWVPGSSNSVFLIRPGS